MSIRLIGGTITGNVDLAALRAAILLDIKCLIERVSFGLMAAENARASELELPGTRLRVSIRLSEQDNVSEENNFEGIKRQFEYWILMNGFRDCAELISRLLDESRRYLALLKLSLKSNIFGKEWNELMVDEDRKFHKLGLPAKLEFLNQRYGMKADGNFTNDVIAINQVRNCLVHRGGFVSERDVNSQEGLMVGWLTLQLFVDGQPVSLPAVVHGGQNYETRQVRAEKTFTIGEPLFFSAQEFSELCFTLISYSQDFVRDLETCGTSMGVRFEGRVTAGADPFTEPAADR